MASRCVAQCLRFVIVVSAAACSSPASDAPDGSGGAAAGGQPANVSGASGAPVQAAGNAGSSPGTGGVPVSGTAGASSGGTTLAGASMGGAVGAAGSVAGGGGGSGSGGHDSAGSGAGGGGAGGGSNAAMCQTVKQEYADELNEQLNCNPNVSNQCKDKVAAAPGCSCRVFMQPSDPFAIEGLANLAEGWYSNDCSMPICPSTCTTATVGKCQADSKYPLGGRCVTP